MASLVVMASGSGSNFEALARAALATRRHEVLRLVCDNPEAYVIKRAESLGVPVVLVSYEGRQKIEAEAEIISEVGEHSVDIIALAGYMRILTPRFVDAFAGRIVNIHPSLLPKYPGTDGIGDSYESLDSELGITIHLVDYGVDTGPILLQKSFARTMQESRDEIERRIHGLEHTHYPEVVIGLLDSHDDASERRAP